MKPSIGKKTQAYLDSLATQPQEIPANMYKEADPIDHLIYGQGLTIKVIHFHADLDLMLIVLSNGKVLRRSISASERLASGTQDQLEHYELIGKGTGIHWPELDEDLSLRGFLQEEITHLTQSLVI